jgi:cyclopropane-fatty-acyl-phospholipid synthase
MERGMTGFGNRGASAGAIQQHYDLGNDFYAAWLGTTMAYSAARWLPTDRPEDLDAAQERKLDWHLAAAKAQGAARVLDVGCGWGAILKRLRDQARVAEPVGITMSPAQADWIATHDPDLQVVVTPWQDFRETKPFDAIISIGAFEHFARPDLEEAAKIGAYRDFFTFCAESLRPGARVSLQSIAWLELPRAEQRASLPETLFPDSNLPNFNEIVAAADARFTVRHAEHEPLDYARTLRAWIRNIRAAEPGLSDRFGVDRVNHYLQNFKSFTLGFESRRISLYRIILEKRPG